MGYKVDELVESMKAEEGAGNTPPAENNTPPAEETPKGNEEPPKETQPTETKLGDDDDKGGNGGEPTKPKEDDRFSRAEFSFRRKLEKASRKHAEDLAERDRKYNELLAQFEELKKTVAPKETPKKREDFASDDEYIDYITEQRVKKILAERDGKDAERRAKEAEETKKAKEQEAELAESQQRWLGHVDKCFGDDKDRAQKFLTKIQYANRNGLGEILDACPVASDFLMNNPNGPKVFEKMLNDRETFLRVFNERSSPLDIYYELRSIERELNAQQPQGTGAQPPKQTMPRLGKPGKQAGAGTKPDIFSDNDAMLSFIRSR